MTSTHIAAMPTGFEGDVLTPDGPGYDDARTVFNAMVDRRPAVIAQCRSDADVQRAVRMARAHGTEIAVRCGGHDVAGNALSDGGLVIDLRRMDDVEVDQEAMTVRVGGGATTSAMDRATQPYGLMTPGSRASTTGVGGFTLGGGSGWLERKYGLACDNLLEAELVTAAGEKVKAGEDRNPDLFWALHGGGGNFGVVTSFTFRLHELPEVTLALLLWPAEAGEEIALAYRDLMETAPDELGGTALYLTPPREEFVPEEMLGRQAFATLLAYAGTGPDADAAIAPMLGLGHTGGVVLDRPYADMQGMLDEPAGLRNHWSAEHLHDCPDAAVAAYSARAAGMIVPSPSLHTLIPGGGALADPGARYPVPWRNAAWTVHPIALWEDAADDERAIAWVRAVRAAMKPYSTGDVYLNFIGDEGRGRVEAGFGAENHRRLAEVKARYDPGNLFHLNQNIRPA
ncbi:FAD-binding oxidoreductase [Actinomadura sp. NEAU-AAG7]|uniref:FAD-binding oxidoreductase n=1 Tax=Actinomadura sp. NEAU-AAG7 TaxID=2839640 RepID=UPI001BE3EFAA|nr:FAD-binding oxidoreductase [Actinomadura sp. NEAU-AAG7]MBT2208859.1 FAD-binding oxidoreductase [Actinomadura sp. NEAU-AAG7]